MCYFNCQGCTTVTTRSLTIFGGNSLIYPSLAHVTSRCVPTNTIKWHPKDNKKQNVFLKGEILEKQKPGCREAKSNVPQKETAMTWFFCFGPFKIAPELCWKVAKQKKWPKQLGVGVGIPPKNGWTTHDLILHQTRIAWCFCGWKFSLTSCTTYILGCSLPDVIPPPIIEIWMIFTTLRIIGPSYRGVGLCIAGFWHLQTTSFEIPWFLGQETLDFTNRCGPFWLHCLANYYSHLFVPRHKYSKEA